MNTRKRASSLIPVRLGALFISAEILSPQVMHQALSTARNSGRRFGDVLVAQNLVSRDSLTDALEVQSLIKTGEVTVETGTQALRDAHKRQRRVSDMLDELGYSEHKNIGNQDVAGILSDSGCITLEQLDQARAHAASNGLPVGRNLVLSGAITPATLAAALNVLLLLRDEVLAPAAAAKALKSAVQTQRTVEETLNLTVSISPHHVRVGELLSAAGLLTESDAMIAVESALLNHKSIGHVLLEYNMVSPMVLDAALRLQTMVEDRALTRLQSAGLLQQVAARNIGIESFLSEMAFLKSKVLELLLDSGVISSDALGQAMSKSPEYETDMLRALFSCKLLTQEVFRTTVRCIYAISDGSSSREQVIDWLRENYSVLAHPGEGIAFAAPSEAFTT